MVCDSGQTIWQHLLKCEADKLQREIKAEKAKVKERLLDENNRLMSLLSKQWGSNNSSETHSLPITPSSKNKQESLYPLKELREIHDQQQHYQTGEMNNYPIGRHNHPAVHMLMSQRAI